LLLLATPFALFNPSWTPFEFEYALKLTKPTRVIVEDQLLPTLVSKIENIGAENIYILGKKIEGFRNLEEIVEDARLRTMTPASPRPAKRDTLAYLVFSSGTTGFPRSR
jgi:acyl-CoA synthetase (AMP-forming)/AMP-acid ligase II